MNGSHTQSDRLMVNNPTLNAKEKKVGCKPQKQRNWLATINRWIIRNQHREELLKMPDYLLKDIGLTRVDVIKEYNNPFWKSGIF